MDGVSSDEALAVLRRKLCGVTVAAFLISGEAVVVESVNPESIHYWEQDGIRWLSFESGVRRWVVPGVQYWTEG